jgi:hypothetical protein
MLNLRAVGLVLGALLGSAVAAPSVADVVTDKYIVSLKNDIVPSQIDSHIQQITEQIGSALAGLNVEVDKVWTHSFKGYSGKFDAAAIALIRENEQVRSPSPIHPTLEARTVSYLKP